MNDSLEEIDAQMASSEQALRQPMDEEPRGWFASLFSGKGK